MNLNKDLQVAGYVMIPRALLLRAFEENREAVGDMNAFLRVLTYVNYAEAVTKCCNIEVACRRGESVISFSHWAEILGWTIGRTRRFFNRLIADRAGGRRLRQSYPHTGLRCMGRQKDGRKGGYSRHSRKGLRGILGRISRNHPHAPEKQGGDPQGVEEDVARREKVGSGEH